MNAKYIENLIVAKESLKIWMANMEQFHYGNPMFLNANSNEADKTEFANWYYGEGQTFSSFETFNVLEPFYQDMYTQYNQYVTLFHEPLKKSLFTNEKEKRQKALDELFNQIKQSSRKLIKSVEIFEDKLKTSPLFIADFQTVQFDLDHPIPIENESNILESSPTFQHEKSDVDKIKHEDTPPIFSLDVEKYSTSEEVSYEKPTEVLFEKQSASPEEINVISLDHKDLSIRIEQKIQAEISKLKKELEAEFEAKLVHEKVKLKPLEKEESTQNTTLPNNNLHNTHPVIDIDEEIRRILS